MRHLTNRLTSLAGLAGIVSILSGCHSSEQKAEEKKHSDIRLSANVQHRMVERDYDEYEKNYGRSVVKKRTYLPYPEQKYILHYTPEVMAEEVKDELFGETPMRFGMIQTVTSASGSNLEGIITGIRQAVDAQCTIIVAPEYSFLPSSGPLTVQEYHACVNTLRFMTKGSSVLLIPGTFVWKNGGVLYNTTCVMYDGEVLFQYQKMRDGGEGVIAEKHGLIPNFGKELGIFYWKGLKVGLEICADGGILEKEGVRDCDLLFLISCAGPDPKLQSIKTGGYAIKNDGGYGTYDIRKKQ